MFKFVLADSYSGVAEDHADLVEAIWDDGADRIVAQVGFHQTPHIQPTRFGPEIPEAFGIRRERLRFHDFDIEVEGVIIAPLERHDQPAIVGRVKADGQRQVTLTGDVFMATVFFSP